MKVLTLSPVKVERLLAGAPGIFFRRFYHYRGELLLACRRWKRYDVDRYVRLWERDHIGRHPVDWYAHWTYTNAIFARAVLSDCVRYADHSKLIFTDIELLDKPIRFRYVQPLWWNYDLVRQRIPRRFPPPPEVVAQFWDWCAALDEGREIDCEAVAYLLSHDPRARRAREGIVKRLTRNGVHQWRTVRYPVNWRITFRERFGEVNCA